MKVLPVFTLIGLLLPVLAAAYPPDIDQGPTQSLVKDRTKLTVSRIFQGDDFKFDDPDLIHGTFDWVYEEELGLRKGFAFNDDGSKIAFWKLDESRVPKHTMIDNTSGRYPKVDSIDLPANRNSIIRVSSQRRGTFSYEINEGGKHALEKCSDLQSPPIERLIQVQSYFAIETLTDNESARQAIAELD